MHTSGSYRTFAAVVFAVISSDWSYGADKTACGFSKPSSLYEQNPDFVRVLNQFENVLDLGAKELENLGKKLAHVTDVPAKHFYYDPYVSMRYDYGYTCKRTGLSTISYRPNDRYPSDYSFCFIAEKGTLDDGEVYAEQKLFLPRKKWINYLDFPNRDGLYGTFLRRTRLGASIRFKGVSGFYYLKYGKRYLSVNLSIVGGRERTTVSIGMFDATEFVKRQTDCERVGANAAARRSTPTLGRP